MNRFFSAALCALFVISMSSVDAKAASDAKAGKAIYDTNCAACHKDGVMNAPKLGDKAAWAPRIKQGAAVMTKKSITGFTGKVGMMMAKGGHPNLTDAQVGDAVAYMINQSK
ncbi:MAG: c-type cytochrome [Chlorobiales bacterium]|nr:c-type cytochrome [Chlorobiales bacterium]